MKSIIRNSSCAFVSGCFMAFADTVGIAPGDILEVNCDGEATESRAILQDPQAHGVVKTGTGTYTVQRASIASALGGGNIEVRTGAVDMLAGGIAPTAQPDCLGDAVLWLKAETLPGDGSNVPEWLDARDTEGQVRFYAMQSSTAAQPQSVTRDGKKWVYFGGINSGQFLSIRNSAGSAAMIKAFHAYIVLDLQTSYGYPFGVNSGNYPSVQPSVFSGALSGTYLSRAACSAAVYGARMFLDGKWIDGTVEPVRQGVQMIELEAQSDLISIQNFFNDRSIAGRIGGDYIGEVVLFTNRLSATDRMLVENYLVAKWNGALPEGHISIGTAYGSRVSFDSSLDGGAWLSLFGGGTAEYNGNNEWTLSDMDPGTSGFLGGWRIASGPIRFEKGTIPLALDVGDGVQIAKDGYGVSAASRIACDPQCARIVNDGSVRIESIRPSVKTLCISGGSAALGAPTTRASRMPPSTAPTYATMEDPGFEAWSVSEYFTTAREKNGWAIDPEGNGAHIIRNGGSLTPYVKPHNAPGGKNVFGMKFEPSSAVGASASMSTTVAFPESGKYEFAASVMARPGYGSAKMTFSLERNGNSTIFARMFPSDRTGYYRYRCITPELETGEYTLKIAFEKVANSTNGEQWGILDDLSFCLVQDISAETVFEVPNGDFEDCDIVCGTGLDSRNIVERWTFSGSGSPDPDVGIVTRAMRSSSDGTTRFNAASAMNGSVQLAFIGDGGTAVTAGFVLPKGYWTLRCRCGRWGQSSQAVTWNGKNIGYDASLAAVVSGGGNASAVSLGTLDSVVNNVFVRRSFPVAVRSDGETAVVLTLRQATPGSASSVAGMLVDDLEFVKTIVPNGGFEYEKGTDADGSVCGGWTMRWNRSDGDTSSRARVYNPVGTYYGRTACEGSYALQLIGRGSAERLVSFEEAGVYRLSFMTRGRADYGSGDTPNMRYAQNRVAVFLASGSTTNEVLRTDIIAYTNFVAYSSLFSIASPGERTLIVKGLESGDKNVFLDMVSIEKAYVADTPDINDKTGIEVSLADGETLRLDYPGVLKLDMLRINGHSLIGTIDATTYPNLVSGIGTAEVAPKGTVIIFR